MRSLRAALVVVICIAIPSPSETEGKSAYTAFTRWLKSVSSDPRDWERLLDQYRKKLRTDGVPTATIQRTIEAIEAYDEAVLYDGVYAATPKFNTLPNQLLREAIQGRTPGKALDIAMGQGRNTVYLATVGWEATGFDVSQVGLKAALEQAKSKSVHITAVHSHDQDFEFGKEKWDLIAIIYAMEKRSVHRIRDALKPGGLVVVEAGHKSVSGAAFEYESKELLAIFKGFRILRYEEANDTSDWGKGKAPIRLVRLIAQKPR